jgi:hypothetical protein
MKVPHEPLFEASTILLTGSSEHAGNALGGMLTKLLPGPNRPVKSHAVGVILRSEQEHLFYILTGKQTGAEHPMATKRSRKATETAIVEAVEDEAQSTEPEQTDPEAEVRETNEHETQAKRGPQPLPDERRCPSHHEFYPEEAEVRPISEFRVKDGRVQPTYCRRCSTRRHTQRSREQAAQKYSVGR